MAQHDKALYPLKYYRDYIAHNLRPDGRTFDKFRPVIVNLGSFSTADGSALAKVGQTTVVCGIKADFCKPKAASPNEGFIVPNLDLPPLCSSKFKPGPPCDQAQVVSQLLADIIENSKCVNLKSLCIFPDRLAWCLYVDLICLDYDGSIIDASLLAMISALKSVTLPEVDYDPGLDNKLVNLEKRRPLEVDFIPIATTFAIFDEKEILADPTAEEENLSTGTITVVLRNEEICAVHKPGGTPISEDNLLECINKSKLQQPHITNLIATALKSLSTTGE